MKETLHGFFGKKTIKKIFMMNTPIFSVIIGEMLCDPEDVKGETHARMMACFTEVGDDSEALQDGQWQDIYHVVIKNQLQWSLAID